MPNWCRNTVTFNDAQTCAAARALMTSDTSKFDFNNLRPLPESEDWYEWCNKNWGTKWNAVDIEWGDDFVAFDTAWGPPSPILEDLSKKLDRELKVHFYIEMDGAYDGVVYPDKGFWVNSRQSLIDEMVDDLGLNDSGEMDFEF